MTSGPARPLSVVVLALVLAVGAAACSSSDDEEPATTTTTTAAGGATEDAIEPGQTTVEVDEEDGTSPGTQAVPTEMAATGADREWCEAVIATDQRSDETIDTDEMASFVEDLQSLAEDAPDEIADAMGELAAATQELYELFQQDPQAAMTIPPELEARGEAASEQVSTWVKENCGGYEL